MADLLRDIGQYLIDNGQAAAIGMDLFLDGRPGGPDDAVCLFEYHGPASVIDAADRRVQVLVRASDYDTARTKAWAIYNLLDRPGERIIQLNGRWTVIHALQTPARIEMDAKHRTVYGFSLAVATTRD
jgi:hypothetical protein